MSDHDPYSFGKRWPEEFELFEQDVADTPVVPPEAFESSEVPAEVTHANRHELLMASPGVLLEDLNLHDRLEIITDNHPSSELEGRLYIQLLPWHNQKSIPSGEAVRAYVLSSTLPELQPNIQVSINGACIGDYMPQTGIIRRDCNVMLSRISMIPLNEAIRGQTEPTPDYIKKMLDKGGWEMDPKTGLIYVLHTGDPIITPPVTNLRKREPGSTEDVQLEWQPASTFNPDQD